MASTVLAILVMLGGAVALPLTYDAQTSSIDATRAVQDQGQCGSCWAFSITQQLATRIFAYAGSDYSFGSWGGVITPEIPVMFYGIGGCNGASPQQAGKILQNYGLPEIACAKYLSATASCDEETQDKWHEDGCVSGYATNTCYSDSDEYHTWGTYSGAWIKSVDQVSGFDNMQNDIYANGPLSVMIYCTHEFMHYSGGVLGDGKALPGGHEILITGWGHNESNSIWWVIKNSWGTDVWGQNEDPPGYGRVWAGANNLNIESYGTSLKMTSGTEEEFQARKVEAIEHKVENASRPVPGGWVDVDVGEHADLVNEASRALNAWNQGAPIIVTKVRAQVVRGLKMVLEGQRGVEANSDGASSQIWKIRAVMHMPPNSNNANGLANGPVWNVLKVDDIPPGKTPEEPLIV